MSEEPTATMPEGSSEPQSAAGISRRDLCIGVGASAALLALGGVRYLGQQPAVRPPGGQDEARMLSACIRCGKCMEVCPHGIIKPQHLEDGLAGVRTPYLVLDEKWCDWCAEDNGGYPRCVEVCPTRALELAPDAKPETTILGTAVLKTDWCLAYKKLVECRWCMEACPYEAIELNGMLPQVITARCNGCGACQAACISLTSGSISDHMDTKAIIIVPVEEAQR